MKRTVGLQTEKKVEEVYIVGERVSERDSESEREERKVKGQGS